MSMRLVEGLRADNKSRIAFVGAGGKTSAMFRLARQLAGPVICMNTTHLAVSQSSLADQHFVITTPEEIRTIFAKPLPEVLLLTGPQTERNRLDGLIDEVAQEIQAYADRMALPVLVEADGARQLPLKAPAAHEPPVPPWVNQVVYFIGLKALNQPLDGMHVFRPEIFSEISDTELGAPIGMDTIQKYLIHSDGGLKNIPDLARKTVFFNQLDAIEKQDFWLSPEMSGIRAVYDSVLIGSVHDHDNEVSLRYEKVAGIVLAAGGGTRMGRTKQLLEWRGKPLIRHVVEKAIEVGLDPVKVVVGFDAENISLALADLPVQIIHNPDWQTGQASSIKAGVESLPGVVGAALFLLSDMPGIPIELLHKEIEVHQTESLSILCPRFGQQRGNPVLFDCSTFSDLLALSGDKGGRQLFTTRPIRWLDWSESTAFLDMDTQEDYLKLINRDENDKA